MNIFNTPFRLLLVLSLALTVNAQAGLYDFDGEAPCPKAKTTRRHHAKPAPAPQAQATECERPDGVSPSGRGYTVADSPRVQAALAKLRASKRGSRSNATSTQAAPVGTKANPRHVSKEQLLQLLKKSGVSQAPAGPECENNAGAPAPIQMAQADDATLGQDYGYDAGTGTLWNARGLPFAWYSGNGYDRTAGTQSGGKYVFKVAPRLNSGDEYGFTNQPHKDGRAADNICLPGNGGGQNNPDTRRSAGPCWNFQVR